MRKDNVISFFGVFIYLFFFQADTGIQIQTENGKYSEVSKTSLGGSVETQVCGNNTQQSLKPSRVRTQRLQQRIGGGGGGGGRTGQDGKEISGPEEQKDKEGKEFKQTSHSITLTTTLSQVENNPESNPSHSNNGEHRQGLSQAKPIHMLHTVSNAEDLTTTRLEVQYRKIRLQPHCQLWTEERDGWHHHKRSRNSSYNMVDGKCEWRKCFQQPLVLFPILLSLTFPNRLFNVFFFFLCYLYIHL